MASSTSNTAVTAVQLTQNESSTSYMFNSTLSTHGFTILADDLSKLVVQIYNLDTAAAPIVVAAGASPYTRIGIGSLSTSIASSEYRMVGPFDSAQFRGSTGGITIDSTSTGSTNLAVRAYLLP
jgi:hypothetical protein